MVGYVKVGGGFVVGILGGFGGFGGLVGLVGLVGFVLLGFFMVLFGFCVFCFF